ncbi:hypothetical protein SAMD00023353_0401250 [Rosellinia necatrix]|uniref:Uncharacterized protein n=1 Tax=Rosellinia necatrix TaxID=77044 RepID=A0A1S7UIQ7_ROSNE|nr:hypothetical protein SAMD00023353_0401250 [Rosellinia necatrix]
MLVFRVDVLAPMKDQQTVERWTADVGDIQRALVNRHNQRTGGDSARDLLVQSGDPTTVPHDTLAGQQVRIVDMVENKQKARKCDPPENAASVRSPSDWLLHKQ